jgi:iron(III) transport system substrate-binding protein
MMAQYARAGLARWFVAGAAALLLALGVACGSEGDGPEAGPDPVADPGAGADPTAATAGGGGAGGSLVVYSGRTRELIEPLFTRFTERTGTKIEARYADSGALAATLLEERGRSPADVFIAQDAGALGAVEQAGLFTQLAEPLLARVPAPYRSTGGRWVGLSGRARVIVYNTKLVQEAQLPASVMELTDARFRGKVGWAPTNGSFQAFVTALRVTKGDAAARQWLQQMKANGTVDYATNPAIVIAVGDGEITYGLVNHYYVHQFLAERGTGFPARNHYTAPGDPGTLVNVAGGGVLATSKQRAAATALLEFMLSEEAQRHFADRTFEYPLVAGVPAGAGIPALATLRPLVVDLGKLEDLQGTVKLLREVGVLK